MCMLCVEYEAQRMTWNEVKEAVKETKSKPEDTHTSKDVVKAIEEEENNEEREW